MSPPTMSSKRMSKAGLRLVERMGIPPGRKLQGAYHVAVTEVRVESPCDYSQVRDVVEAAFEGKAEADLVEALRSDDLRIASLVAVEAGRVVGHVMFSRVWIDNADGSR